MEARPRMSRMTGARPLVDMRRSATRTVDAGCWRCTEQLYAWAGGSAEVEKRTRTDST